MDAFTVQGDGGIHVVGVGGGPGRLLLKGEPDNPRVRYVARLTWASDSEVVVSYWRDSFGRTVEMPQRRLSVNGSKTNVMFEAQPGADKEIVSPDGRWVASYQKCCGGGERALWIRDAARGTSHCAAGPFRTAAELLWLDDSGSALLVVNDGKHQGEEIYLVPMSGGAAPRLVGFPISHKSASLSSTGTLAIVTAAAFDSIGRLWLTTLPARTDAADTLGHSPNPDPRITRFVGVVLSVLSNNPSVHAANLPVSKLAQLGARGPRYASFVIGSTRLGNDANAVASLARLPRNRYDPSVQAQAHTRLRELAPTVLADRKARESTVFEIVCENIGYGWTLDFSRHPAARHSIRILTVLAAAEWPQGPAGEARQMLTARGMTIEDGVFGLVEAARGDSLPPDVLDRLESVSAPVQRSYPLQRAMSLLSGRYAPLRTRARQALAQSAATPDSVLLYLARTVDRRREDRVVYSLVLNPHAVANPEVVATLRAQGIAIP